MDKIQVKVLLIEDNPVDVILLRETLEQDALNSFELSAVERLQSAAETLSENSFDIILLDLGLPDSQGLETFTQIHQFSPETPKIILSGLTDEALALQAVQAGAQDYLVKGTAGFASAARAIRYAIERQRSQIALRASEERFRAMIENGLDDISLLDAHGTLLWGSPSVIRNLGYPVDAFVGQNIFGIVHPDDRAWTGDVYTRVIQTPGSRETGVFRLQHVDGSWRWVEAIVTNMLDNPIVKAIVVNYRDITERKQAEEALRASEKRYRLISENSADVIWTLDLATQRFTFVSPSVMRLRGLTPEEVMAEPMQAAMTPDSYRQIAENLPQRIRAFMAGDENSRSRITEVAQLRKDGSIVPTEVVTTLISDANGKVIEVLGVTRDITQRKLVEAALLASETRYHGIFDGVQDAIFVEDLGGNILDVNRRACEIFGYTHAEFVTKHVKAIVPAEEHMIRLWEDENISLEHSYETINVRANGEQFPVEIRGGFYEVEGRKLFLVVLRDITERKQGEQALRVSEEKFRSLIAKSTDGIVLIDEDGLVIEWNSAEEHISGIPTVEALGVPFWEIQYRILTPERREKLSPEHFKQSFAQSFQTGISPQLGKPLDVEIMSLNGERKFIQQTAFLIQTEKGHRLGAIVRDVTESKRAELEIKQRNDDLRVINTINAAVVQGVSLHEIMDLLAKELKQVFGIEGTSIYLLDLDEQALAMQQFIMSPELIRSIEKVIGSTVPLIHIPIKDGGYFQKLIQAGQGTILNDPEAIQQWMAEFVETSFLPPMARNAVRKLIPQIYKLMRIQSTLVVPLIANGKAIGLLDASSSTRLFTHEDLQRIDHICGQLTAAIQRQQANELVLRSEAFLNSVQNALSAHMAILDEKGTIVRVNAAWRKFGEQNGLTTLDACLGVNYLEVCDQATGRHAEEAHATAAAIRAVLTGHRTDMLLEYPCHAPHEQRWFILHITKFEEGEHVWVVLAHENITERKLAEQHTLETEKRFRALIERAPDGIVLISGDGKYKYASPTALRLFDYRPEEIQTASPNGSTHPDDLPAVLSLLQDLIEHPAKTATIQYRFKHKDGTWRWLESTFTNMLAEPGVEAIVINFRDITERRQAEEAVKETSEQFRTLFEASPEAIMLVDPNHDWTIMDCNATGCAMNGYTPAELIGQSVDILNPTQGNLDERTKYLAKIRTAGVLRYEASHRRKDGTLFPIEVSTSLITLGGREVILGIDRDITERKQAEDNLRKSEALYRQAMEVAGTVPYYESYYNNGKSIQYEFIGEGIRQITGYGPEEFNANLWDTLVEEVNLVEDLAGYSLDEGIQRVRNGANPIWKCEHRIRDRAGNLHWVFEAAVELYDEHGAVYGSIGTYQDITARKQTENSLRESEHRYRALFEDMPIATWEEDFSEAKQQLEALKAAGVTDFQAYFAAHPEVAPELSNQFKIIDVNNAALQMFQAANKQELIESTYREPSLGEQEHAFEDLIAIAEGKPGNQWEGRDTTLTGKNLEISLSWSVVPGYEKDYGRIIVTTVDITERKRAENELKHSHSLLTATFESTADGILVVGKNGEIISFNNRFLELWQIPHELAEQGSDRLLLEFVLSQLKDPAAFIAKVEELYHAPEETSADELEFRDGRIYERYSQPQRLGSMVIGRVWSFRDITERKQNEQKLVEANERFHQLADNIQEVFWITDAISGEDIYISPAGEKIWDHSIQDLMQVPNIFINSILPEDRQAVIETIEKQRQGQKTEMEYRIVRSDGSHIWVWDRAFPILDEAGNVVRVAGIAADITERKQVEDALQRSEDRYRQLLNVAPIGVAVHVDGKIEFVNGAGAKIIGANSVEELQGHSVMDIVHPDDRKSTIEALQRMLAGEQGLYPREERFVGMDGRVIPVEVIAVPLDYMGRQAVQVIVQDITERKHTESEIRRHLAELEALYENGLAVGRLLEPREIGERIIATFEKHLAWHHVAIRLIEPDGAEMKLIAFNQEGLGPEELSAAELHLKSKISIVGQGLSGWVAQTGRPLRTGNVRAEDHYIATFPNIQSGLYMPLKIGAICIGVISVESDIPNAFTEQDERLLATLANQAAIAFENARLYEIVQHELDERTRAEIALRASETHYRELTDSITDIFFEMDQNLCYTHWNKASELLTGIPEASALGRSMHEVMGVSEEQTRIEKIYESVLLSQHPTTFETHVNFNHQVSAFEVNAYPSTRGVAVVAKDVSERKRSEVILQKRYELMEYAPRHTLLETMQRAVDEVVELTGSHIGFFHILAADQSILGLQIWGTKTFDLFKIPVSEAQHQEVNQAGVWAEAVRQRRAIIHNDYESLPDKKGLPAGHAALLREIVIPIIRNETILAVLGVGNKPTDYTQKDLEIAERFTDYAWDVIERKQMELALAEERNQLALRVEERTADFSRANANLARALRVKDEFLANMSHELRTPLNAILGLSESLAEQTAGPLNEKQMRYITTVSESGHHLLSLINDILDLAKIEAGQITLDVNKVDIHSVCDASLRMIKQLARKKNQETFLVIDHNIGLMWADERRLKQMLVNLLSNAVKFTPDDGKLGLEVQGDREANKVTFTIWDTGIGIKAEDMQRLFQPFVQLDAGLARESSGTGLGLALVAQMARLHGGSTSVVSEPGKGSRFTIMLPWEPVLTVDTVERLKVTGKFRPIKFSKERKPIILLVEDTEDVIMMVSDYLELNGFKVVTARDGFEGVAQAQLTHPDLILMDIQMPRMDGFEATQKLRSESGFKKTPIIALTALAMPNDRERCLAAGMDEYITKPVHLRALVKLIENFLAGDQEVRP